jgi:plastocyanin
VRRLLLVLTLLTAPWMLAAGCGGTSGSSGASSSATATTQAATSSGGGAYGGSQTTSGASTASGTAVTIDNFAFSPATLKVKIGQQVTWTNKQGVPHTVTADDGAFDHPMPSGATFSFAFDQAGTFAYHCKIHPSMHATIMVS